MRTAQWVLHAAAGWLIITAVLPGGTLYLFVIGLALLLAATGCASIVDNIEIRFGGERTRRPARALSDARR